METQSIKPIRVKTDVLVIDGGLAGCNAAMGAAEAGASVVVTDKGKIERSGDIGGGVDHFMGYLGCGPKWDTRDAFLQYVGKVGRSEVQRRCVSLQHCRGCDHFAALSF